jgi:hypothetical protein
MADREEKTWRELAKPFHRCYGFYCAVAFRARLEFKYFLW